MAALVPEIANAVLKGLFGALGVVFGARNIDLLQGEVNDIFKKTTLKNVCIFYLTGIPGKVDHNTVNTNAWLKCGDQENLIGSWLNAPTGKDFVVSDPQGRVGDITINYEPTNAKTFPFPGRPNIKGGAFAQKDNNNKLLFDACVDMSKKESIWVKDCHGKIVIVNVCQDGFLDGSFGEISTQNIIDHGPTTNSRTSTVFTPQEHIFDCHIKSYFDQAHLSKDEENQNHNFEDKPESESEQETYEWADKASTFVKKGKMDKKKRKSGWAKIEVNLEVNVEDVNTKTENNQGVQNDSSPAIDKVEFPFSLILRSTTAKRESKQELNSHQEHYQPLIILIRDYVQKWTKQGHMLLITTDCSSRSDPYSSSLKDSSILCTIGRHSTRRVTRIVPVKSQAQRSLLEEDEGREIEQQNVRKLQRKIQQYHSIDKNSVLLQPHTLWYLDEGSPASTLLRKKVLDGDEFEEVANRIGRKLEVNHIEKVLIQDDQNIKALDKWHQPSEDDR
ncbi:hypothetical protein BGZ60DRAFT_527089 [Tricladium varicosporioides]|nr:hypothetical protein BGZ60DRAFT_527089 [Hymenoscyphus varicosporioides]